MVFLDLAFVAREHWQQLTIGERTRLNDLVRRSKGRPSNLSKRERDELRRLVDKLDVPGMGRAMIPFVGARRRR
jgi:hypothetical protein